MARGWESKSVEAQMEEAESAASSKPRLSPEQLERKQKRESLELTKKKLQADLERAGNERHREMLARALADLEAQLKALD